jgi:hypothetical protein
MNAAVYVDETCYLPEDGQALWPKPFGAIINCKYVVQFGYKYCICDRVAWKMYNIRKV